MATRPDGVRKHAKPGNLPSDFGGQSVFVAAPRRMELLMRLFDELEAEFPDVFGNVLRDPEWILRLDEHDQPAMWTRSHHLAALRGCSVDEIATLMLGSAIKSLRIHADFVCSTAQRPFGLSLRLTDHGFDEALEGVPDIRLWVAPEVGRLRTWDYALRPSDYGRTVQRWLDTLPLALTEGLAVLEDPPETPADYRSVWIVFDEPPCRWITPERLAPIERP
ncbi:MAG: hypothetical protein R2710_29565 [Acidimicrobiales bacterium]